MPRFPLGLSLALVLSGTLAAPGAALARERDGHREDRPEPTNPPEMDLPPLALKCGGGPGSNYVRRDVPFSWFDTTGAYGWDFGDDEVHFFNLPFPVDTYSLRSQVVAISSNGWISLTETEPASTSGTYADPMPDPDTPAGAIAPWWNDMDPSAGGTVNDQRWLRLKTFGYSPNRVWVATWERFPAYGNAGSSFTFQVALYETTNVIRFQYLEMIGNPRRNGADPDWVSIGVENAGGTMGIEYLHDQNRNMTGRAMEFSPYFPALSGCAAAAPLACGARLTAQAMGAANTHTQYGCSATPTYNANETVFALDLTGVNIVSLTVTPSGAPGRTLNAFLMGACNLCNCLAGDASSIGTALGPGRYYVVVDGPLAADTGPFDLSLDCEPILSQPTGSVMNVGDPVTCPLQIAFDRFADGRGVWSNANWIHEDGDRTYHALRVNGGRIYATNPERSSCLPMQKLVSWVDDNTDKAVVYWRVPEAEILETVLGKTVTSGGGPCCGLQVDTRIRNKDTLPHFFEFRSLYQPDYGPGAGTCFLEERVESGPVRVGSTDYTVEQDLSCGTPAGLCGLVCQTPIELKSGDDLQTKVVVQNTDLATPDALRGEWVAYYDAEDLCGQAPMPWTGLFSPADPTAVCDNVDGLLLAWRLPPGTSSTCSLPADCVPPGGEVSFSHLFGDACRLSPSCGACSATADLIVPERSICLGRTETLDASGSQMTGCPGTVMYTWSRDGVTGLPGTSPTYVVNEAAAGTHTYDVEVSCVPPPGGMPCSDSRSSEITVFDCSSCSIMPRMSTPASRACLGEPLLLDARASQVTGCPGTISYQWLRDGVELPGETSGFYTVAETTLGAHDYGVRVSCDPPPFGLNCQATSNTVLIDTVPGAMPSIVPTATFYCPGGAPVQLDAGAGFTSYAWLPTGETTRTIDVTPAVATTYSVTVTNINACMGSDAELIDVSPGAPAEGIIDSPVRCETPPLTAFRATSTSAPPVGSTLAYEWTLVGNPAGWSLSTTTLQTTDVTVTSPVVVTSATLHLQITTLPGGCVSSIDFPLTVTPAGQPTNIGNTLLAVKTVAGMDLSWAGSPAAPFAVHTVGAKRDITSPPGTGIFNTAPVATPTGPFQSVVPATSPAYYQARGFCP